MYLSHPVRRIRDDPRPGESVALVVTAAGGDEAARDATAEDLASLGATVEERLRFGAVRIRLPQETVSELNALDGIESVETAATRKLDGGDAGEDV